MSMIIHLILLLKLMKSLNVNFNINYIEDDRYVNARINLNPNTGDNVYISFIILGASTCCLIISLVINKKNKKKILRIIIIGVIGNKMRFSKFWKNAFLLYKTENI